MEDDQNIWANGKTTPICWQTADVINCLKLENELNFFSIGTLNFNLGKGTSIQVKLAQLPPACPELGRAQPQLVLSFDTHASNSRAYSDLHFALHCDIGLKGDGNEIRESV